MFTRQELLRVAARLQSLLGVHPKSFSYIRISFFMIYYLVYNALTIYEIYINWESVESLGKSEMIPLVFRTFCIVITYLAYYNEWIIALEKIELFWPSDRFSKDFNSENKKIVDRGIGLLGIYFTAVFVTCTVYNVKALFTRELQYPIYEICDATNNICFGGIWFSEIVIQAVVIVVSFGFEIQFTYSVVSICCEFEAIKYVLKSIDDDDSKKVKLTKLYTAMKHHAFVLEVAEDIKRIYARMFMIEYGKTMFSVCVVFFIMNINGIPPSMERLMKYSTMIMAFMTQFSVYCIGATALEESSLTVIETAYNVNWYVKTEPELRRGLALLILRAQKPATLTIGGLSSLGLKNIIDVWRAAMSVFTLMRNLQEKQATLNELV